MTAEKQAERTARAAELLANAEAGGAFKIEKDDQYPVLNNFRITVRRVEGMDREYLSELLAALAAQTFPNGALVDGKPIAAPITVGHVWWTQQSRSGGQDNVATLYQVLVSGGLADKSGNKAPATYTVTYASGKQVTIKTSFYGFDKAALDLLVATITGPGGTGDGANNRVNDSLDEETGRWSGVIESFLDTSYSSGFLNQTGIDNFVENVIAPNKRVYQFSYAATYKIARDNALGTAGGWNNFNNLNPIYFVSHTVKILSDFRPEGVSGFYYKAYTNITKTVKDITADYWSGGSIPE